MPFVILFSIFFFSFWGRDLCPFNILHNKINLLQRSADNCHHTPAIDFCPVSLLLVQRYFWFTTERLSLTRSDGSKPLPPSFSHTLKATALNPIKKKKITDEDEVMLANFFPATCRPVARLMTSLANIITSPGTSLPISRMLCAPPRMSGHRRPTRPWLLWPGCWGFYSCERLARCPGVYVTVRKKSL